ncbi:MAG: helix-turn-helix transcriptional regulator [Ruminococcus sp.]|nr:helix-turn-helix transcriptional regulator [Ruminococcus sp.]
MSFCEKLNEYLNQLNCSGRRLAELSGISEISISRFRRGERVPARDSDKLKNLAHGLCKAAEAEGIKLDEESVLTKLASSAPEADKLNYPAFLSNLKAALSALGITNNELARELNYDPSYISRILSAQRKPADTGKFASSVAAFIAERCSDSDSLSLLNELFPADFNSASGSAPSVSEIVSRLCSTEIKPEPEPIFSFLEKLDEFDLNEYLKAVRFEVPNTFDAPKNLPEIKSYYGIEEMKQGELDFLRLAAASKEGGNVFLYTDMPMHSMAADNVFTKKWMLSMAAMLKNGLNLHVIHDVNRPPEEMLIGLESYIPMYMTGLITPYYLKKPQGEVFLHLLRVADSAALTGEAISGYHSTGRYTLYQSEKDVGFYRTQAELLLKKAQPLMKIFRADRQDEFDKTVSALLDSVDISMTLSGLPLFTVEKELLEKLLLKNGVDKKSTDKILLRCEKELTEIENALKSHSISLEIPLRDEPEEISLSVCSAFYDKKIFCDPEEYKAHLKSTREFAAARKNLTLIEASAQTFRNIHITVAKGRGAIITKSNAPTIHFVITHPKLLNAIESFKPPITE